MKKLLCKLGLHSSKLRIKYNPIIDGMPKALCLWCGKDCIKGFGIPPAYITGTSILDDLFDMK
jgi:hypothetical protein